MPGDITRPGRGHGAGPHAARHRAQAARRRAGRHPRDAEKERLTLVSGQSRFALQTLAGRGLPRPRRRRDGHEFELGAHDLKRLIDKTRFAISTEETRYYLNGIYLHTAQTGKKATLRAVATDGHRLAQVELPLPKGAEGMPGVIIPRKTVHELHRLIEDSTAAVKVGVSPAKVRFEIGSVTLTSKLIDGTFPDYGRVIPQGNDKEMQGLQRRVHERGRSRVDDRQRARAGGQAQHQPDKLVLSVNNPEGGSATEEIGVDYGSTPLEIGFNARYLLDIAGQLEGEEACFMLADPGSPTMVRDRPTRARSTC